MLVNENLVKKIQKLEKDIYYTGDQMLDNIEITVDNFASINSADFELNKITVIKGGDFESLSDLNRIIFANLISLSGEGDFASTNLFRTYLKDILGDGDDLSFSFMIKYNRFVNDWQDYNVSYGYLSKKLKKFKKIVPKKLNVDFTDVEEYLALFKNSKMYRGPVFSEMIRREFKTNKIDEYDDYEIKLTIDGEYENFVKCKNKKRDVCITYDLDRLPGNVIYMDKVTIFDLAPDLDAYYHYEELYSNMTETYIECEKDTFEIEDMIEDVIGGGFGDFGTFYFVDDNGKKVEIDEVSVAAKQLGTLELLLEGYGIPEKSILMINNIDDEMDGVYIKKTAEIITKLALELDLLVLINTQRDDFAVSLKECYDDLVVYNAFENDDGKYDFRLEVGGDNEV